MAGFGRYYSRLVERASRRKEDFAGGGSVTLVLLQPSVSVLPSSAERKEVYTLSDFEGGGFTQTVCSRVAMLEEKGIPITQDVLIRVGIPLPGSDHPAAGRGQRSQQHLEELTSLVDGHIDLRENLASAGRVPPIDPSNSLTRIGVGSTKLVGDHTASRVTSPPRALSRRTTPSPSRASSRLLAPPRTSSLLLAPPRVSSRCRVRRLSRAQRPLSTTPAMAAVNSAMRLNLAAASDPGNYDAKEKTRAAAYTAALQQPSPAPLSLGEEVCVLYATSLGLLDGPVAAAGEVGCVPLLRRLLEYVDAAEPLLLPRISESGLLGEAAKEKLKALIADALEAS